MIYIDIPNKLLKIFGRLKKLSYIVYIKHTKGKDFLKSTQQMETQMTRKEAAIIMKKYEKNGMIGMKVKPEYFIAKQIWKQRVKEQK
jgi:hypothetical protein